MLNARIIELVCLDLTALASLVSILGNVNAGAKQSNVSCSLCLMCEFSTRVGNCVEILGKHNT